MAINVLEVIRQGQVGGGESHLLDLIAGFDNRVNPIVLSFTGGQMIDALTQRGVKCHVVNTSHPFDVRITRQIKELILRENIQLIHAHGSRAASNVAFIARKLHIPMVYTVHGWSFHQDQSFFIKRLRAWSEKIICKLSKEVICVSESNRITGQKTFGLKHSIVIEVQPPPGVQQSPQRVRVYRRGFRDRLCGQDHLAESSFGLRKEYRSCTAERQKNKGAISGSG